MEKEISYEMEELLPIIIWLTEKYTSKESTSVSYERARHLMEAVIYCIQEYELSDGYGSIVGQKKLPAKEAYHVGYKKVIEKVRRTQSLYNEMLEHFSAYGNENYHDTVTKGLPAFFLYYDARFAPQETVITMDYPVFVPLHEKSGINAVSEYVESIYLEQVFLSGLSEDYIYKTLSEYQSDYGKQFYNICSVVLRKVLSSALSDSDMKNVENVRHILAALIHEKYDDNGKLFTYLERDLQDFIVESNFRR